MSEPNQGAPAPDGNSQTLSDRVRSLRISSQPGAATAGRSRLHVLPWIFAVVLLLTSVAFGYRAYRVDRAFSELGDGKEVARENKKPQAPGDYPAADVPEEADTTAPGEVVLQAKGYVTPINLIQVSPKVGGQLLKIADGFTEGARFKKGAVLAWIEDVDYKAEMDQAKAVLEAATERYEEIKKTQPLEVKQAEADLEESRQSATQLRLEMDRNKRLRASASVAEREYEQARYAYTSMTARIKKLEATLEMMREGRLGRREAAAKAEVASAEAAYRKAKWRYENCQIKAPVNGIILSKKAEEGNIVNPSAFSSGISASLCEMADLTKLEVDLSIQERDVARVQKGMPCQVMPEAYSSDRAFLKKHPRGYEGFVSRLMPTADRAKGAVPVRVQIRYIPDEEAGMYLRPEMSALVSFMKAPAK